MNYDRHSPSDEAFSVLSPLDHPSQFNFTSTDPQLLDSSLSLAFVTDHSLLDPSLSAFVASYPSNTASPDTVNGFELPPLPALNTTPTIPGESFDHTDLSPLSPSTSTVRDGPGIPKVEPWSSIAVTCQPMTDQAYHQQFDLNPAHHLHSKLPTDSGYGDSLHSALLMKDNARRQAHDGPRYAEGETLEAQMRQMLPDQQLPVPSGVARTRPRPSMTSAPPLETPERFQCTQCSMSFSTHSEHQKHVARHEKKWVCQHANCTRVAGFATSNDLDRHRKGVHKEVGLDDPVWKCFVDGCRTPDKIWTRQDNFRAHIERMHKNVDIDEYVQRSEEWLEETEKPRRQGKLTTPTSELPFDADDPAGPFQYSGAMTEQTYPASRVDVSEYARSVAGEFPDTRAHAEWNTSPQSINPYVDPMNRFAQTSYHGLPELGRSVSNNPNMSLSSMNPSGIRNDPTLPSSYRGDEDLLAGFHHTGGQSSSYLNVVGPFKARTEPDLDRSGMNVVPEWAQNEFDTSSMRLDIPGTGLQSASATDILSYVGGDTSAQPMIAYSEGDVLGHGTVTNSDLGVVDASPTVEEIAEKSVQDHQQEINNFLKKFTNPHLRAKLSENIAKTIKEYSSSRSVNISNASVRPSIVTSPVQDLPYRCTRAGCSKKFAKRNRLTKHEKRHDRVFFCTFDDCYKRFGTKTDLSRHEYRCHHQDQCWRCWTTSRSRDKKKECAELFKNEAEFEEHRKVCHSKVKLTVTDFKIERDFAGAFWCGFCNKVVENGQPLVVTGNARANFRYQHIEWHMNDIYHKTPGRDAMQDWVELGGRGKTKAEAKEAAKRVKEYSPEDDDSDEEDDGDEGSPPAPSVAMISPRQRSVTTSHPMQYGRFLHPSNAPAVDANRKRPASFATPEIPSGRPVKARRTDTLTTAMSAPQKPRHLSISSAGGPSSSRPLQQTRSQIIDASNANSVVAYVKCCHCNSAPRLHDGAWTCLNCWHTSCERCQYYGRDKNVLQVVFRGLPKNPN